MLWENSVGLLHCFFNYYFLKYFPVSTIFRLDFGTVLTVWDVLIFILFYLITRQQIHRMQYTPQ